jgi:predicted nuclease of predicted toxin-antitoxin system
MEDDDILAWAVVEGRIVITIDKDFGTLAVALGQPHRGMVRLPDVSATERQRLMEQVLTRHETDLEAGAIITVSRSHIRVRPG